MNKSIQLFTALAASAAFAGTAQAAMVFDLVGSGGTTSGLELSVTDLTNGSPTEAEVSDPGSNFTISAFNAIGTLSGVSNTDSIAFTVNAYETSSLSGNDLTLNFGTDPRFAKSAADGWSPVTAGGNVNFDGTNALAFTFDLSGLPVGTFLRITDVNFEESSTAGTENVQVIVDGSSVTELGGQDGSGLSIDVADGEVLAFRQLGTNTATRLKSFTFEAVPEPSSLALLGLGGLLIGARRRHG